MLHTCRECYRSVPIFAHNFCSSDVRASDVKFADQYTKSTRQTAQASDMPTVYRVILYLGSVPL